MTDRVLVDASVWVDVLRDPASRYADRIAQLMRAPSHMVTTGVIVQEVLQGRMPPRQLARVSVLLVGLPRVSPSYETHERAAALSRRLRTKGVTTHTVDVLLAQLAMEHDLSICSLDRHFVHIARVSKLRLVPWPFKRAP